MHFRPSHWIIVINLHLNKSMGIGGRWLLKVAVPDQSQNRVTLSFNTHKRSILIKVLSKPQPNLNTRLGLTWKWLCTPHHPTETQYQDYLSCYWLNFDETLKIGSWEHLEQIPTVMVTFVQATFVLATFIHIKNI